MAQPFLLQGSFERMWRDASRHQLPPGSCWNLVDFLPDVQAPAAKRGGWTFFSGDLHATDAGATRGEAIVYADFSAGAQVVVIDQQGKLYKVPATPGTIIEAAAASGVPLQNPFLHRQKLIVPQNDGTTTPKYYDGTTVATLTGAPAGKYGGTYKDYSVLGNTVANPNRLFFSNPGDPTTWDTTNSWWDATFTHTGLAFLKSAILIFSSGHLERLRGSIPPAASGAGSDFVLEPLFEIGCADARSIVNYGDSTIWANTQGVYITDGASYDDLTEKGGIKQYWGGLFTFSSPRIVGGLYQNRYVVTIWQNQTLVDALVCEIESRAWYRLGNMNAYAFAHAATTPEELYFVNVPFSGASAGQVKVSQFSSIYSPKAATKNDADGTAVQPSLELPFFEPVIYRRRILQIPVLKVWRGVWISYDLRDAAADVPTLAISYVTSPESTSYTSLTRTLPATSALTRPTRDINKTQRGLGFKISQSGPSATTSIYSLEAQFSSLEGNK